MSERRRDFRRLSRTRLLDRSSRENEACHFENGVTICNVIFFFSIRYSKKRVSSNSKSLGGIFVPFIFGLLTLCQRDDDKGVKNTNLAVNPLRGP